jgi:hypothetical protein
LLELLLRQQGTHQSVLESVWHLRGKEEGLKRRKKKKIPSFVEEVAWKNEKLPSNTLINFAVK